MQRKQFVCFLHVTGWINEMSLQKRLKYTTWWEVISQSSSRQGSDMCKQVSVSLSSVSSHRRQDHMWGLDEIIVCVFQNNSPALHVTMCKWVLACSIGVTSCIATHFHGSVLVVYHHFQPIIWESSHRSSKYHLWKLFPCSQRTNT